MINHDFHIDINAKCKIKEIPACSLEKLSPLGIYSALYTHYEINAIVLQKTIDIF